MRKKRVIITISALAVLLVASIVFFILEHRGNQFSNKEFHVLYPFEGALFPPEYPAPTIRWRDADINAGPWEVSLYTKRKHYVVAATVCEKRWKPPAVKWDSLKNISDHKKIFLRVGRANATSDKYRAKISFQVGRDEVGAPILYREMPLPFIFAEQHLDSMSYRLVNTGSPEPPHYVMKKFMVCGNCHSFSAGGDVIGLDFDAARRDKGGYFIEKVQDTIVFDTTNFVSFTKLEKRKTFGSFSKLSPDGRYIITTIKDRAVLKNFGYGYKELFQTQLFFMVNGVLAVYDRLTGKLWELPGADSREYVHTNSFWTPDGKSIIFARAKALPRPEDDDELVVSDDDLVTRYVTGREEFKYDLYIIPFNEGRGGKAQPIEGASHNGKSNYFPALSPDGKWLVFCQAENFMLLMPDSKLYIMPAEGGKPRKLKCNFNRLNSWHAWSPNSKWLVYVSKVFGPYTDMFLTHIDEKGRASIPVLIENAKKSGHVANYPEFINRKPGYTFNIIYDYINISHIQRAIKAKDFKKANELADKYVAQGNICLISEYYQLYEIFEALGRHEEAKKYLDLAMDLDTPENMLDAF
jgi:hypothetical protein